MIIALEGGDFSGKSSVAKMLATGFYPTTVMRDPGTTVFGERVREILLDPNIKMAPMQLALTFMAIHDALMDHAQGWEKSNPNGLVILDRCFISTLAYQYADGANFQDILHIGRVSGAWRIPPENIYFISVPQSERMKRMAAAGNRGVDRFESKPVEFWERLQEGYRKAGEEYGFVTVDGVGTVHQVASRIYNLIDGSKIRKVW